MMVMEASASTSLKEYLKRYESNTEEEKTKKKKKKKKTKTVATGVLVVDEDPVWQKPMKLEEEEDDSPDEKPQVDEDIEVKRMKRLEQLRARLSYNEISEDGSGWFSVSDAPKCSTSADPSSDISPPHNRTARYDIPSSKAGLNPSVSGVEATDLSPPRQPGRRNDTPSPEAEVHPSGFRSDPSPPRQRRRLKHSSLQLESEPLHASKDASDASLQQQHSRRYDSPSPRRGSRASHPGQKGDLSPPCRRGRRYDSPSPISENNPSVFGVKDANFGDISSRRVRPDSPDLNDSQGLADLSPPRKSRKGNDRMGHHDIGIRQTSTEPDLSPPRKRKEQQKTGLITGKDVREEIAKTKKDEWLRFKEMDPSASGRGAEPVYRIKGERISKEEYVKLTKKEEKTKEEKNLEWGKGLAQKREAEARLHELELAKNEPFARSRNDPELDKMMKDRLRWGDPMAHLVKKKQPDLVLPDLGEGEKMKDSGFIVPQEIPNHSWIKRGLDFERNRYGIKPGRHWDGVNRSNGYEKQLFKRMNEKQATEREAYLWSVSDM